MALIDGSSGCSGIILAVVFFLRTVTKDSSSVRSIVLSDTRYHLCKLCVIHLKKKSICTRTEYYLYVCVAICLLVVSSYHPSVTRCDDLRVPLAPRLFFHYDGRLSTSSLSDCPSTSRTCARVFSNTLKRRAWARGCGSTVPGIHPCVSPTP